MEKPKIDHVLDVRGTISPFSLLKASLLFQQMKPSEVLEILGCDPEMRRDLLRLLPEAAYEVLSCDPEGGEAGTARMRLRKACGEMPVRKPTKGKAV
jgi:TusA-related sulfurtransferase